MGSNIALPPRGVAWDHWHVLLVMLNVLYEDKRTGMSLRYFLYFYYFRILIIFPLLEIVTGRSDVATILLLSVLSVVM